MSNSRKTVQLLETVLSESLTSGAIDREAGVIRGVKVLGRVSKNGREYSDKAMDDGVKLYEGLRVNVDHPDRKNPKAERQFIEGFGELRNVRKEPSGVFADMHFKKAHPSAELVCESAERFPKQFGLSHNAEGEVVKRGGKPIVESLIRAESVDIVGKPATNEGLFESHEESAVTTKTIKASVRSLVESAKSLARYKLANLLEMEGGDAAMMGAPMDMAMPVDATGDVPADADGDGQIDDAFKLMITSVLDDATMDVSAKIKRIGDILKAQDKLMNGTPEPAADDTTPAEGDESVAESVLAKSIEGLTKLVESQAKKQAEQDARFTLIESKRAVTPERVKALVEAKDEAHVKLLLESYPAEKQAVAKPSQSRPLMESTGEFPKDNKSFLREIGAKVAG